MFVDRDVSGSILVPSVRSLYALAVKEGMFPGVERTLFDRVPFQLLFAAVDPEAYLVWAHRALDQAGVPPQYRRFDHLATQALLKAKFEALSPRPTAG